ncbi:MULTISPECIES: hypothetical protein [unclassified Streptomyces]|uniref:hypothetical protein n=1 Tax=unclassified Streptomyces TaxID=2593676 RepID=UPI0029BDBE5D|nr:MULTISPECIES: hypothetical protein [unclassified Streptomyces]MDX3771904.1 hypothetical protein [Streptomyces sp. AK08-01B]MDX3821416.1 hypothetical protein [Streptomyces sp. AK08-01A]
MNGIESVLRTLHRGERHMAQELVAVSERHRTEHEVSRIATDIATWSREHVRLLTAAVTEHGLHLSGPPDASFEGVLGALRRKASEGVGGRPEPGLLLLRDLRDLHLAATHNSLYWEMLAQAAQATKDTGLLGLASSCHPQTLRQMRWTNTMIKNLSPQILASL